MAASRQNTPGLGIEYEVHLPAYFALLLNSNSEIEDFRLRSNVEEFGNLDDLLVDIKTRDGENLYFAFQLKHKENFNKNLLPTNFEAKGDFNLEKYCEAFKKLNEDNRKYHFILYTNKNFDSSRTNEVKRFDMRQDECCLGRNFFDTSGDGKNLYKFEVNSETEDGKNVKKEDYREFFSRFSLYTGQANIRDLDKSHILDILKYKECYVTYIDFFRRWHRGDFIDKIIDKKTLNIHLVDILLSSVAINFHLSNGEDGNSIFFETMVQQFDITVIDASKQEFIKQLEENVLKYPEKFNNLDEIIKLGKRSKLIDRFTKELNEKTKHKLLHYFFHKPLILDFHKSSEDLIYEASKLCRIQEIGIKLVILGQHVDLSKFSHLKIFTNLTGVNENFLAEAKRRCNLSLQGRNFSFEEILEEGIRQFVTPKDIFQMLKGTFSIGEDNENLPEFYIPRTVSATIFDVQSVIKHSSSSSVIIFYCKNEFENFKIAVERVVRHESHLYEYLFLDQATIILRKKELTQRQLQEGSQNIQFLLPTIVVSKREYSRMQLNSVLQELRKGKTHEEIVKEDVHLFKAIDGKGCLLLMSTKNISYNENLIYTKRTVEEDNIHVVFNSSINILCAQPGMGKSTLMKYLRNKCETGFWALRVDLKAHNDFFKRNRMIEEVLKHFLQLENCQDLLLLNIKKMFFRRKKIVFFLDGLDEVENECVDRVLTITSQLSEMGFRIWLSSRQNLQQIIEHYFNILAIEINELSENQQKNYIEKRLKSLYSKQEIEEIVDTIFNNTDLVNNRQHLEIPLQLHIITQIFLDDKSYYSNLRKNNIFILTKMFEIFFRGKYQHFVTKIGAENTHLLEALEERLEYYELVALHSVLDDEHFQKLQIENFKLPQIKKWDIRLGIITKVNRDNKAVFDHMTFAEYFASKFLVKNFDKTRILKEEIFTEKYQNLRIIFNIMLAEDSPLHLAIIYKNLSRIEELGQSSMVDKGGRNFLQMAACVATRHPVLESEAEILFRNNSWLVKKLAPAMWTECKIKDKSVQQFKGEDSKIRAIVNHILPREPFKNDKIFEWNSLDYALVNGALYIVEAILEKFEKSPNFYELLGKYYSDEVVAYYSIRFGYHRLLSEIIAKNSCHVTGIFSDHFRWKCGNIQDGSILHFLFTSDCTNRTKIIELLTDDDINKIVYVEEGYFYYTLLHFAVFHNDIVVLKFLLEKKIDVNVKDDNGKSSLFASVVQNNFEITKLLVEKGADINIKENKHGWSPLFFAVRENNFKITQLLVERGADVNIKDRNGGISPLILAIDERKFEIAKYLLEKAVDVNITDKRNGWTPLFSAVTCNTFDISDLLEISKLLVEKGANVNVRDKEDGRTPLCWAVRRGYFAIAKLLVEKGADVNIKDKEGWSPLLFAVDSNNLEISKLFVEKGADTNIKENEHGWSPLFFAVRENNFKITQLLVERGADVNIKDRNGGRSPLLLAIDERNFEIAKYLLQKAADVNIIDKRNGRSPLFSAMTCGFDISDLLEISKLLVEKGADVNVRDKEDGRTPLCWAVCRGYFEIAKLLVEKGADVNIKDKKGKSPLFFSVDQNNFEITKLLVEKRADVNGKNKKGKSPLFLSVNQNNFEITKFLVEKGADVNIKDKKYGRSPLFLAIERNNLDISKFLIEKGANVNIKENENGWSPLFFAVRGNNFKITQLLVERGADVNIKDRNGGRSPLLLAIDERKFEIAKYLLEKEVDVNIIDKRNGRSPLLSAVTCYSLDISDLLEISKLLVEKGANVNVRDKEDERTPLCWAARWGYFEIAKLLIEKGADVNIKDKDGTSPLLLAVQRDDFVFSKLLFESGAQVTNDVGFLFYPDAIRRLEGK